MISILDLSIGNLKSIENSLDYIGVRFKKIKNINDIDSAKKIIIPGVGAFDYAMSYLEKKNYIQPLKKFTLVQKKPILGICIGMQIFFKNSNEGKKKGLAFFEEKVVKLKSSKKYKVPNVGFSKNTNYRNQFVYKNLDKNLSFYFTNSYAVKYKKKTSFDNFSLFDHNFKFYGSIQKNNILACSFILSYLILQD